MPGILSAMVLLVDHLFDDDGGTGELVGIALGLICWARGPSALSSGLPHSALRMAPLRRRKHNLILLLVILLARVEDVDEYFSS